MNNSALAKAQHHVFNQHQDSDGFITVAKKNKATGRFKQYHYNSPHQLAEHLSSWIGEDTYFSQNTFYKPIRRLDTIRQLRSLYVDLDVYNIGVTPEWMLGKLELEVFGQELPEPNMVIFSGRGLVLIWKIEPVPYKAMPLWRSIEDYFTSRLKDLGADSKCVDPTRIFRIAGSINSKSGSMVRVEYRHDYEYSLRDIQYEYLPELEPIKLAEKKPGRPKGVIRLFNTYSLHTARAKDIATLIELRQGRVEGYRQLICFLYRYWTCCYTSDREDALRQTLSLNEMMVPPLSEKEVKSSTRHAERAWEARNNEEANRIAREAGYPAAGYNIKNTKLIEWLDITEDEQKHMLTIIGTKEKRRRDLKVKEEKRREQGVRPKEEYNQERSKAKHDKVDILREHIIQSPKLSNRKIAKLMGVSEGYIRKLKKLL